MKVILHLFFQSSRLAKKRAVLTIASIAWGTVAILLLLAFGEGLKRQLSKNSKGLGVNISVMWPSETTKAWKGMPPGRPIRLRMDDVDFLNERMSGQGLLIGELVSWRTNLSYGRKTVNGRVIGTSWTYGDARHHFAQAGGRFFSPVDESEKRRVVFLGDELAKDLFGKEEPVGKALSLNNSTFTVIGVMGHKTMMGNYGGPEGSHAVIPQSTFRALFGKDKLNVLLLKTKRPEDMVPGLKRVNELLGGKLGYDPSDERALSTWNTVKSQKTNDNISIGIERFLGIIGVLTLLIGGVGVANIMYAVVRERTREIGVKMALGARAAWITGPFVLEGLLYTAVGGAAGMVIAILLVTLLGLIPMEGNEVMAFLGRPTLSPVIGLGTAAILGVIGVMAGYFPARRAAAIDPAATLRYE
ncbi:MAG: ABC transporter permease [Thermoanaerobaculia bacterium]